MNIFRVARHSDIDAIFKISSEAGLGLSTVPKTLGGVESYVSSTANFVAGRPDANSVLFVLESDGVVVGMSGIIVQTDSLSPFWSFERKKIRSSRIGISTRTEYEVLELASHFDGCSELGTLLLSEQSRGKGLGRLLSMGRLAFINSHRTSFNSKLMADIRGWQDRHGEFPFWTGLSSKFIDVPFVEAERLLSQDKGFLPNFMPLEPIYLRLLDTQARQCIGKPNERSAGALSLLSLAGFTKTNFCNVLDGGPALECDVQNTVVAKTESIVRHFSNPLSSDRVLQYSGTGYDFRATIAPADMENATISEQAKFSFPDHQDTPIKLSRLSMPEQFPQAKLKRKAVS